MSRPRRALVSGAAALAGVALAWACGAFPATARAASASVPSWRSGARPLADLSRVAATTVAPGGLEVVPLEPPFAFRGAAYDVLMIGPEAGVARLAHSRSGAPVRIDEAALVLEPLGPSLVTTPSARVQLRREGALLAVRWVGLADAFGEPAAHDVLLEPGGIAYQYLQVPRASAGDPSVARLADRTRAGAVAAAALEGFVPRAGAVVEFPGDVPWDPPADFLTGCDIATNWCTVVTAADPDCITPSGHGDESTCAETVSKRWHFNEGAYCRSCPYTFYIAVECGTEMHLPFLDMEGNQIRITDVFTGTELELEALNDCARTPFRYCDLCANGSGIFPDPNGTRCSASTPRIDCIPYLQRSTVIQWGHPMQDLDGDGLADDLPCGPPNRDACFGNRSGAWPAHEEQNTDVVLRGDPAVCGVFRLDVVSGGFHWFLSANCTGIVPTAPADIARNFDVYQNCADALAAFDPVPELAISRLEFTGTCPDIELEIEVSNLGCVDAPSSPVFVDFDRNPQPDVDLDLGAVAAGTSVVARVPVSLRSTPMGVTVSIDPANVVSECTEQLAGEFSGCRPAAGADSQTIQLCQCASTPNADAGSARIVSCGGALVTVDGSASRVDGCASPEYRFVDGSGAVVRDWGPSPMLETAPARCPSLETWKLEARCAGEINPDCMDAASFEIECAPEPTVDVQASPTDTCWGERITLTASPGLVDYAWEDGARGPTRDVLPAGTTTYRVMGVDRNGCAAQGQVTVTVRPDPVPGPLGAWLRARREGADVVFSFRELPQEVGDYRLVVHEPSGPTPCVDARPTDPTPVAMEAAAEIDVVLPGDPPWSLRHAGGVETCPKLLFYKVRATSPCTFTRGTTCDGFPMQYLPCP